MLAAWVPRKRGGNDDWLLLLLGRRSNETLTPVGNSTIALHGNNERTILMTPDRNELRNDNENTQVIDNEVEGQEVAEDVVMFRVKTALRAGPFLIIGDDGGGGGGGGLGDGQC
jgi:hypothetical protein